MADEKNICTHCKKNEVNDYCDIYYTCAQKNAKESKARFEASLSQAQLSLFKKQIST